LKQRQRNRLSPRFYGKRDQSFGLWKEAICRMKQSVRRPVQSAVQRRLGSRQYKYGVQMKEVQYSTIAIVGTNGAKIIE